MLLIFLLLNVIYSKLILFPTFENIGVTYYSSNYQNCTIQYTSSLSSTFHEGHPLIKVGNTNHLVTSLMFLKTGTKYRVKITHCDGLLLETIIEGECQTMEYYKEPNPEKIKKKIYVFPTNGHIPTGSENCTEDEPCSVQEGLDKMERGYEIVFKEGLYMNIGDLKTPQNIQGTKSEPIVIRGEGEVILDGSKLLESYSVIGTNPNIYKFDYLSRDCSELRVVITEHKVTKLRERLVNYDVEGLFNQLYYNTRSTVFGYYCKTENEVYLNFLNDNIEDYNVYYANWYSGLIVYPDYTYISNLYFRNYGISTGLRIYGSDYSWVKNCIFEYGRRILSLSKFSKYTLIEYNEFRDTSNDALTWDGMKATSNFESPYLLAFSDNTANTVTGRGMVVRRNEFHGMWDCFTPYAGYFSFKNETNEIDIYENYFHDIGDDAISSDHMSENIRIYSNVMRNVLTGISVAPAKRAVVFALNNSMITESNGFKFNVNDPEITGVVYMYNNVLFSKTRQGINLAGHDWQLGKSRNNILMGRYGFVVNPDLTLSSSSPVDLDYDALFSNRSNSYGPTIANHFGKILYTLEDLWEENYEFHGIILNHSNIFQPKGHYLNEDGNFLKKKGEFIPGIHNVFGYENPAIGLLPKLNKDDDKKSMIAIIIIVSTSIVVLIAILMIITIISCCLMKKKKSSKKYLDISSVDEVNPKSESEVDEEMKSTFE